MWFAEEDANRLGRITHTGVVTVFSLGITAGSDPYGITAGPDGNLWFTEYLGGRIGRITPQGVVTEFSTGINSEPQGIAAGPDGNLWFPDAGGIGRITPSGVVTQFAGPGLAGQWIAAGPDGNMWFTEPGQSKIGRITTRSTVCPYPRTPTCNPVPAGTVTQFPLPSGINADEQITAGPDGNMWFLDHDKIGRITPTGAVTVFPTGLTNSAHLEGITAGPDGNLWFTDDASGRIGHITTTGTVSTIGLDDDYLPEGIVTGPDGNIWFASGNDAIGRITP